MDAGASDTAGLFQAFQQNLLSLLSHELRTPMMGVLNPLRLLDDGALGPGMTSSEMLQMARRNAERLHRTLETLLDLAAIEGGAFHARLREVDLTRLVRVRARACAAIAEENGFRVAVGEEVAGLAPVLGDLPKLARAVDLSIEALAPFVRKPSRVDVASREAGIEIGFELDPARDAEWARVWSEAQVAAQSRLSAPGSPFAAAVQSEQAFLSRAGEGLGSELWLVHELLRLHQGRIVERTEGARRTLTLEIPSVRSEDGFQQVLASRLDEVVRELSRFALVRIRPPRGDLEETCARVQATLSRRGDSAYPYKGEIALLLDECGRADLESVLARLARSVGWNAIPVWGAACAPEDGLDATDLLRRAEPAKK